MDHAHGVMVLQVLADAGIVGDDRQAERARQRGRAEARDLQQMRRPDRASGQHDVAVRMRRQRAAFAGEGNAGGAARRRLDAQHHGPGDDAQIGAAADRREKGARRTEAAAPADAALVGEDAFLRRAIVVRVARHPAFGPAIQEGRDDRMQRGDVGDMLRSAGPAMRAVAVVFEAAEIRQHLVMRPAPAAGLRPIVEIPRRSAHPEMPVDRGGAAEHPPARRMDRPVVHAGAGFGDEIPVKARIAKGLEKAGRDLEVGMPRLPTGFQQQHTAARIGGEAVGQHAAGAARADDDVVPIALEGVGRHAAAARVGAVPATQVRTMWRRSVVVAKGVARCSTARLSQITRSCGRQRCA